MERKGNILMKRYEIGKLLGQGTFAKVHHARNLKTGQSVAIKIIDKEKIMRVGLIDQIKREISVMRLVKHPNVVQLHEVMASKSKIYFAMEYVRGGELFTKVAKGRLKEDAARKYFQQLIAAVDFCHSRGVYHRDLKPENLLLDEFGNLKVSDFGLSALLDSKRQDGLLHTTCGTPAYVAPEVINKRGYDGEKADIWSCGVILFVLLAGYLPFQDSNLMEMYKKICRVNSNARSGFRPRQGGRNFPAQHSGNLRLDSSHGFDLSGLFEKDRNTSKAHAWFTTLKPPSMVVSKLEELAVTVSFKIKKKDGIVKMQGSKGGRKGQLAIDAEIFEVAPSFHMVEVKKTAGDTLEYVKFRDQELKPSLKDVIWSWQGSGQDLQKQQAVQEEDVH
ncbi:hypothetical protein DH2020_032737 [Rehmannia glutinosa]|uniref:Protein kinase domain-containing protein n=1 Tax=Rehmannia glutinosa TaxID=99300 RepID=A0ABR0VEB5_REHGL